MRAGQLVVATPVLQDPNFARTVVLLLQADEQDGALGLVLNRPTGTGVDEVLPDWAALSASPSVVFSGGPVQPQAALCLGHRRLGGPLVAAYAEVEGVHTYRATLRWPGARASSEVSVRVGAAREATPLDHFVSERWRLHTSVLRRPVAVHNTHETWPLHDAEVVRLDDGLLGSVGFHDLAGRAPDHVAWSPGVHAQFGLPRPV